MNKIIYYNNNNKGCKIRKGISSRILGEEVENHRNPGRTECYNNLEKATEQINIELKSVSKTRERALSGQVTEGRPWNLPLHICQA